MQRPLKNDKACSVCNVCCAEIYDWYNVVTDITCVVTNYVQVYKVIVGLIYFRILLVHVYLLSLFIIIRLINFVLDNLIFCFHIYLFTCFIISFFGLDISMDETGRVITVISVYEKNILIY